MKFDHTELADRLTFIVMETRKLEKEKGWQHGKKNFLKRNQVKQILIHFNLLLVDKLVVARCIERLKKNL